MRKGGKQQVLIDGFPRNEENRAAFESQVRQHCALVPALPATPHMPCHTLPVPVSLAQIF